MRLFLGHRWVFPLLAGLVLATATSTPTATATLVDPARTMGAGNRAAAPAYAPGEVVVQFRATATPAERQAIRDALGTTRFRTLGRTRVESARISRLTVDEAIARFENHPLVEWIEPDYRYATQVQPNDPSYRDLWGLSNNGQTGGQPGADISAPRLWDRINSAPDVVIAIIDTGTDHRHEDLAGNIFVNPGEIADNGIDDDGNGFVDDVNGWDFANDDNDPDDDNGHGTHVAGIAGAVGNNELGTVGVAWNVRLMPVKFLDHEGVGTTSDAVAAIDYALWFGVKIINASWGGSAFSNILRQAVQRAEAEGALFVAAAGNSTPGRNNETFPFYPSSFDLSNIIAVAATDHEDRLASFSHFGVVSVDLAAPGVDILGTRKGDAYGFLSGTSMATPHISGALALYKSRFPEIGMAEAKALVLDNVDPVESLVGKVLTGGRFNAFRPVADPDDTPPARIGDLRTLDPDSTRIDLEWTATGDDAEVGSASRFEVRYSLAPIAPNNFDYAAIARNPPAPGPAGSTARMRIEGLAHSTTYYFAVKALDEFGNSSPISNTASGTTLGPPAVTITPAGVDADLFTGQSASRELTIVNDGDGEYIYEIVVRHLAAPPGSSASSGTLSEPAGARPPGIEGLLEVDSLDLGDWMPSAAPGNFEATDETAANGSRYSMHGFDATSGHFTGVHQVLGNVQPAYAGFYVRSASVSTADAYFVLRDESGAEAIFFFADNTGKLFVNGAVGGNAAIPYEPYRWYHIEFKNIDFQSRTFDYHVDGTPIQNEIPFRNPFVENIHRVDLYNFHGGSEAWWDEVLISTEEPPSPVSVDRPTGVVPAGGQSVVTVEFSAVGLNGGDYHADVLVAGNDPVSPQIGIAAILHVTGAPDIEVVPGTLDFGSLFVGGTVPATLSVANRGTDELTVTGFSVEHADFDVGPVALSLDPNEAQDVVMTFRPSQLGPISGTLVIHSNDPDQAQKTVTLLGNGLLPPAIAVNPVFLEQQLFTGERADQTLRVENTGFSELEWEVAFPASTGPSLEEVRQQIDGVHTSITGLIPNAFAFLGGESSYSITDGGEDMYDTGNFISTNLESLIPYSTGAVLESPAFGPEGRYFTRKYPKLFLFAADMQGVDAFAITGNLGADGAGLVDGTVLHGLANGVPHLGFVKRAFGAANPSVNHLIVVAEGPGITHDFSTSTNSDFHVLTGLGGSTRLYYLLYASRMGVYVDHETTRAIFETFLRSLDYSNAFLDVGPISGRLASGATGEATITFDAAGLADGVYTTDLAIVSNDPLQPSIPVTASLLVVGAPDIWLSESTIDFNKVLVGDVQPRTLVVRNDGAEQLHIEEIASGDPAFVPSASSFELDPGGEFDVELTFSPTAPGIRTTTLTIVSDDPDEGLVDVVLRGEGLAPPQITVSEDSLVVEQPSGESVTRSVTVGNAAGSDLVFAIRIANTEANVLSSAEEPHPGFVSPGPTGEITQPTPIGSEPPESAPGTGTVVASEDFTFSDDFEDGNLDGWLGGSFGFQSADDLQPPSTVATSVNLPALEVTRPSAPDAAALQPQFQPFDSIIQSAPSTATAPPFRAEPTARRLAAGETVDIVVTFDATELNEGTYNADMIIASNDPQRPEALVPLAMTVNGTPDLGSSRDALHFGVVQIGLPQIRSFTLTNFGSARLEIHDIVVDGAGFTLNATRFDLAPGDSRAVVVTFAPEVPGFQAATVTVHSNSPGGALLIQLTGEGHLPAAVSVSTEALSGRLFKGQAETRTVTLSNVGGEDLEYAISTATIGGSAPPQQVVVFLDDIEGGPNGWTSEIYSGDDLWHQTRQQAQSPETSWACNIESEGHYASADPVSTAAISPPIDLREALPPVALWFFERYETEPVWDQCMVDVSTDGGTTWTPLRGAYGSAPAGSSNGWVLDRLSLSSYVGRIVRVRFYFETSDQANNQFPGWFFDDVTVTAEDTPWVAVTPIAGVLPPGQSQEIEVRLEAGSRRAVGEYSAVIEIMSNDPFEPLVEIPTSLEVLDPPRIAFPGDAVTLQSRLDPSNNGRTTHLFSIDRPPAGAGRVLLTAEGDYGGAKKTATATAEAVVLGRTEIGSDACGEVTADYALSTTQMEDLASDGQVSVEVRNSPQVTATCAVNTHDVTLTYPSAVDQLNFGSVLLRGTGSVPLTVANNGSTLLTLLSMSVDHDEISLANLPAELPAETSATVWLSWTPTATGSIEATLSVLSSDPARPVAELTVTGLAIPSAQAQIARDPIEAALPPHSDRFKTRSLQLTNTGQAGLNWSVPPHLFAEIQPTAGVVAPGGSSVDLIVRLTSTDLSSGDYTAPLVLETDDPQGQRIEIPLTLHVGEVEPDRFEIDFSPHFATINDTVEVSLQLPGGLDPAEVMIESIALFDELAPIPGQVAFDDLDLDGVTELIVQFDLAAFEDRLPRDADPQTPIEIIGEVENRTWFRGLAWPRGVFPIDAP